MSDVFWNDLDSYLVTMFDEALGADSAYSTLKVATVNSSIFADAHTYATWTLPAIVTAGWRITYDANQHMGSSGRIYRKKYQCLAYGIVSGVLSSTQDTVTANVKTLYERMEGTIRSDRFTVNTDAEKGRGALIQYGELDVVRYPADNLDSARRMGVAYFVFEVESTK